MGHLASLARLVGNAEHALDVIRVLWMTAGGVAEEGVDSGQTGVASSDGIAAFDLEVGEEFADHVRLQVREIELADRLVDTLGGEDQQEPKRVLVGRHGVRAGVALPSEAIVEEGLDGGSHEAHGNSPSWRSRRSARICMSSGVAERYQ